MRWRFRVQYLLVVVGTLGVFSGCDAIKSMTGGTEAEVEEPVVQQTPQPAAPRKMKAERDYLREMLIDPPQGEWPEPLPELTWYSSLEEGWAEVAKDDRPLLVLVHCPESDRSGNLDEVLLSPPPELAQLLRQFVAVELTDAQQIDQVRMRSLKSQDPDQTWWCWILSPQGQIYSVLGREHPESSELTAAHFAEWAGAVLDHHWDPRRLAWNADGKAIDAAVPSRSIIQSAGYEKWREGAEYLGRVREEGCMCCHQVQDVYWCGKTLSNRFVRDDDYWLWPPPPVAGIRFARESSPLVEEILTGSVAEQGGLKSGLEIGLIEGQRVFSATDVRAMIHQLGYYDDDVRNLHFAEGDAVNTAKIGTFTRKWSFQEIKWRNSIGESVLATHPGFIPLPLDPARRSELGLRNTMALGTKVGPGSPAWKKGLRPHQIVIALGGIKDDYTPLEFLFRFAMDVDYAQPAQIKVLIPEKNYRDGFVVVTKAISVLDIPQEALRPPKGDGAAANDPPETD